MTLDKRFILAYLVLLAAAVPASPTLAADDPEAQETFEGDVTVGPQIRSDDQPGGSAKFGEYRDVPSGFVGGAVRFTWQPKTGYILHLDARDISQRDQQIFFDFGKQDTWKVTLDWYENPRRWSDVANQLYGNQGDGIFTLADSLQAAVQAAPASVDTTPADGQWDAGTKGALIKEAIASGANDVDLRYQRRTGVAGVEYTPTRSVTLTARAETELRSGFTPQSLGMYFNFSPSEVAAPLDFRTDNYMIGAEFDRASWNVGIELGTSEFRTDYDRLVWDNQLFATEVPVTAESANPNRMQMTSWYNNKVARGTVFGGVNLPGKTRIDAQVTRSTTTQDEPFLPMTVNTLLTPAALPAQSFDGEQENNLASLRVSSRPFKTIRWSAWYRDYEFKNSSPGLTFLNYVQTDFQIVNCGSVVACGGTTVDLQRRSLPYGYEKSNLGAMVGWRPLSWLDASLGYDRESIDREFSAVEKSDEDIYKLTLDFDVNRWLSLRTTLRTQQRRADEYDAEYLLASFPIGEAYVAPSNEGMRRFYWTDRDRDSASLMADVTISPKFSIYAEATYAKDDYLDPATGKPVGESYTTLEDRLPGNPGPLDGVPESYTLLIAGRENDKNTSYTLGFNVTPTPRFNLYADYTAETFEYSMASRYRAPASGVGSDNPLDDWGSDIEDTYDTATLGLDVQLNTRGTWHLAVDGSRSEGKGDIATDFVPGGSASGDTTLTSFPQLKSTLTIGNLALRHAVNKDLGWTLRYWYEKWDDQNFAQDFAQPYMGDPGNDPGSATSIYLGWRFRDYTNHLLSFMLHYSF